MPDERGAVEALILVDLQRAFVTEAGAVPGAGDLLHCARSLLDRARAGGALVIHLQNDGADGAVDEPGQHGWELQLSPLEHEPVLRKANDDGFAGTDLADLLMRNRVGRLAIAGVLSEMCVAATARTALAKGFSVVLPHDAHATYAIPASDGYGPGVPAWAVARVAEWSLGDEVELVESASSVTFDNASGHDHNVS